MRCYALVRTRNRSFFFFFFVTARERLQQPDATSLPLHTTHATSRHDTRGRSGSMDSDGVEIKGRVVRRLRRKSITLVERILCSVLILSFAALSHFSPTTSRSRRSGDSLTFASRLANGNASQGCSAW